MKTFTTITVSVFLAAVLYGAHRYDMRATHLQGIQEGYVKGCEDTEAAFTVNEMPPNLEVPAPAPAQTAASNSTPESSPAPEVPKLPEFINLRNAVTLEEIAAKRQQAQSNETSSASTNETWWQRRLNSRDPHLYLLPKDLVWEPKPSWEMGVPLTGTNRPDWLKDLEQYQRDTEYDFDPDAYSTNETYHGSARARMIGFAIGTIIRSEWEKKLEQARKERVVYTNTIIVYTNCNHQRTTDANR